MNNSSSITYTELFLMQVNRLFHYISLLTILSLHFNAAMAVEIYSSDFETGSFTSQNGFRWTNSVKSTVSSEESKSGSYSLKFSYPGVEAGKDSFAEQRFSLGGFYPDVWIKYDLYVPMNYYHRNESPTNNKAFVWLWAGSYNDASQREGPKLGGHLWANGSTGTSEIVAYASARENGVSTLQKHWNCSTCDAGKSSLGITSNDKGHWMTLVIHMKYASSSNNDGVMELWKTDWQGNTIKLINIQDGSWYSTKPDSTEPARGFDNGYLLGWANSGFDNDTNLYIDNITFSTDPLIVGASVTKPNPPIPSVN